MGIGILTSESKQEVLFILKDSIHGFCMALADSMPGVSGGTVAFIMGFYDQFIGSIYRFVFGGMNEKESFRQVEKGILFFALGCLLVVVITWLNGHIGTQSMDLSHFSIGIGIKLFLIGMVAISAMFLPGIAGSTLLLIFGAYIPVITAIRGFLGLQLGYLPALIFFGFGVLCGAVSVVRGIQFCLKRYRVQSVYTILGMMVGSFYAIVMGSTTLANAQTAMGIGSFRILVALTGIGLVLGMQKLREKNEVVVRARA